MRIAVTGSSGFIGSRLVHRLESSGVEVVPIDIQVGIDLTDWQALNSIGEFDVLYHLAAKTYVPESFQNPRDFYRVNVLGTINALELCRKYNARCIFASSYVYGTPNYLPIDELHPIASFNPYAQSKVIGEQLCSSYNRDFGVRIVIFRPFNIYGTGQDSNFLIPTLIKQAGSGRIVLQDPAPKRDMVYIDDVTDAYVIASGYEETPFEIFNIGSGVSYSVHEIAHMVASFLRPGISIEFTGIRRKNEVLDTVADITKVKKLLKWEPKTVLRDGLYTMCHEAMSS